MAVDWRIVPAHRFMHQSQEKVNKLQFIGIVLALAAIVLMTI